MHAPPLLELLLLIQSSFVLEIPLCRRRKRMRTTTEFGDLGKERRQLVVPGFGHARALSTYHDILGRILVHVAFNSFNDLQNHMPRRDHGRGLAQVRLYGYLIVEKGL
uniref:Secreted protein n=1 Tax=Neurospora intermedia TaxID=5142 RepID=A0ABR3DQ25_NEUIN